MEKETETAYTTKRIGGYLHRIVPIVDSTGKIISQAVIPLMVELRPRDLMQIIVGASLLAIPVGFTEETWALGESLPLINVLALGLLSIFFLAAYIYFNFYRYQLQTHLEQYIKRVTANYVLSLIVVGVLLTIIEKCPWGTDNMLALKRIIIVAFPSSMSAALSDTVK